MKNNWLYFTCILLLFWACSSSSEEEIPGYIEISPNGNFQYEYTGGIDTINIKSNKDWTVEGETEWCYIKRSNNTNTAEVHVEAYEGKEERTAILTFKCGDKTAAIGIKQYGMAESGYIDMKFDTKNTKTAFDKISGKITINYPKDLSIPVRKGKTIVLPANYNYEIRVIDNVVKNGQEIVLETKAGNMCDLFKNTEFTLSTDPKSSTPNAILPQEVGYLTEDGIYHEIYNKSTSAGTVPRMFSYNKTYNNLDLYNVDNNRFYWHRCVMENKFQGEFYFKFGETVAKRITKGRLDKFDTKLYGSIIQEYNLKYQFNKIINSNENKEIKKDLINTYVFRFLVGNTPVIIKTKVDLNKIVNIKTEGSVEGNAGYGINGNFNSEIHWTKDNNITVTNEFNPAYEIKSPNYKVSGILEGTFSYYPTLQMDFYDFAGATIEPIAEIKEKVKHLAKDNNHVWEAETISTFNVKSYLNTLFATSNLNTWSSETQKINEEMTLKAPAKIDLVTPTDSCKINKGQSLNVSFKVSCYSPINKEYIPCQGAFINCKANSGLQHNTYITDNKGIASMVWTPSTTSNETNLVAELINTNDKIIDKNTLTVFVQSEIKKAEMVDLGLSVKWASWNLGAEKPEDYGSCYAWAEIKEKPEYTWYNYSYWKDSNNDGSVTWDEVEGLKDIENTDKDIAHIQWGENWRMPTSNELDELIKKCTWEWTTQNGVNGRKVTGPNGNSIFLPATGYYTDKGLQKREAQGFYWSSIMTTEFNSTSSANRLYFCQASYRWQSDYRYIGGFIRPVSK